MKIVIFFGICLVCVVLKVDGSVRKETFKCVKGVGYRENHCNICHCYVDTLACTIMNCPGRQDPKLRNCIVGTTWKDGCHKCWCVKDKGTLCTLKCDKEAN
ncbi:hypothetical protein ILUMI_19940 [Ignelater luminosus]|uniref:Protease inhibitor n=1 Tax=Ignelater luminosus TaxID=2038154 RepID=A0A8K0CKP2_IGNLU|nr:hypothetical protein ILUMI_19940 [Ignelater luminosus]